MKIEIKTMDKVLENITLTLLGPGGVVFSAQGTTRLRTKEELTSINPLFGHPLIDILYLSLDWDQLYM
jgi:hypothetical protein